MKSYLSRHHWTLVILAIFIAQPIFGQTENKVDEIGQNVGSELGFHVGRLLPDQINGLTEIISGWGLRYGMKTARGFVEAGTTFYNGEGTRYNSISISMRADIPVESMVAQVFAGLDLNQISTPLISEASYLGGGHVGGGILSLISGDVWFRADMKFNINPGASLYIGFGFIVRIPDGGGGGSR